MNPFPYAIAAGSGFALALVSGLLGGVGLGEGILRGFLVAILFGAGAFGLHQVLLRFLPELFTPPADVGPEGMASEPRFDITVGEQGDNFAMAMEDSGPQGSPGGSYPEVDAPDGTPMPEGDLEDVDTFSARDSFPDRSEDLEDAPRSGSTRGWDGLGSMNSKDDVLLGGMDEDPATLAKAVQSVLKREND